MNTKPPLGLMPKWLHDEVYFDDQSSSMRMHEIESAINRYKDRNKIVPAEWENELKYLNKINEVEIKFNFL